MKILLSNSVPLNGGDEALLRATVESMYELYPEADITVLCSKDLGLCKKQIPDIKLNYDLECVQRTASNFYTRAYTKITKKLSKSLRRKLGKTIFSQWIDIFFENRDRQDIINLYREADIIISSPGGFLHDFYAVDDRLDGLDLAVDLGKPVVIFAQSIGPFWKPKSIEKAKRVLNKVSAICVRDTISLKHLENIGVDKSKVFKTADAAFLWRGIAPDLFNPKSDNIKKIGLCFRAWPLDDPKSCEETIGKAVKFSESLLSSSSIELKFISTCQGISGYIDDSEIALKVVESLPKDLQSRCEIDYSRYAPRDLIRELGKLDAFIGMRLHGCILSMLGGTPAMGLGYESKTEEIFKQLELEKYQVRFDKDLSDWLDCKEKFLDDIGLINSVLPSRLDRNLKIAKTNLQIVTDLLSSKCS